MPPKKTTPKKGTKRPPHTETLPKKDKTKAEMDHDHFYIDRLKQLRSINYREWLTAKEYVTQHKMSYQDAWLQILLDRDNAAKKAPQGPNEQGTCRDCQEPFSKAQERPKLKSMKCGHVLCGSCVENLYLLHPGKCSHPGCNETLRSGDWEEWQPSPQPSGYAFGALLPFEPIHTRRASPPQLAASQINSGSADDEGLFVTDEEGSELSGEGDAGDDGDDGEVQVKEEEQSGVVQDEDQDSDFEITYKKRRI